MLLAADPTLTPQTLSDSVGNAVDANSDIVWAAIPEGSSYKAGGVTYDAQGMEALYNMMRGSGMVCVYISNDQFTKALYNLDGTVSYNLDDVTTYLNNTVMQVKHIGNTNFNFTTQVIYRDLDNIGYLVGIPLRTTLKKEADVDSALNSVTNLKTSRQGKNLRIFHGKFKMRPILLLTGTSTSTLNDIKSQVKSYVDLASTYNQYRWYGGIGLTSVILIIVLLQILGLVFGVCGHRQSVHPTERGCLSNSGGNMLMASTQSLDIDTQLDGIDGSIDLSNFEILTPDLQSQLNDLKSAVNINFTAFYEELNKTAMTNDLSTLASALRNYSVFVNDTNYQAQYLYHADSADNIKSNQVAAVDSAMASLEAAVRSLETAVNGTSSTVDTVIENLNITQEYLRNNASTAIKSEASAYANRLFGVVDSYVNDTLSALDNEIGKCTPVWNLYNSIIVTSLCRYTIDTLNGFWFALGWCIFFFVPSVIFSVKLAKHYRRMKYTGDL
ncbi:hypothetical protein KUTeg_005394 [Tegillarca granosa]|uniref:Uncharacterized protein n=1 Tax=Tegillarca granosa TaxID=220873 RepID=A0ABQ9FP38_TEGGR|nr:hypothetical protein KUTeg_005394 [Tegillarca granosa]